MDAEREVMRNNNLKSLIKKFWDYFELNQKKFFMLDSMSPADRDHLFDILKIHLTQINENLTFEFGSFENGYCELTLSADGIEEAFLSLEKVYDHKPFIDNWIIHKFRQPMSNIDDFSIEIGDIKIEFSHIRYRLIEENKGISVLLFIPGYSNDISAYEMIKFLCLDASLGEYDAVKKVKYCAAFSLDSNKDLDLEPLKFLKEDFDYLYSSINEKVKMEEDLNWKKRLH
jgi:hypothetical protein